MFEVVVHSQTYRLECCSLQWQNPLSTFRGSVNVLQTEEEWRLIVFCTTERHLHTSVFCSFSAAMCGIVLSISMRHSGHRDKQLPFLHTSSNLLNETSPRPPATRCTRSLMDISFFKNRCLCSALYIYFLFTFYHFCHSHGQFKTLISFTMDPEVHKLTQRKLNHW